MKKIFFSAFFGLFSLVLIAQNNPSPYIDTNLPRGTELRVLRLAVSCAGEFTQSLAGTNDEEKVEEAMRQIKTWLEKINVMYGREYSVRFELLPDNELRKIIFTNPNTDPWPDMNGAGCEGADNILGVQGQVIDDLIGEENYDFSHVVLGDFNGGCAGAFKSGYSGGLDLKVTRHEMGHQFSQSHTINGGNNNNYEPENAGRSVQGGNTYGYAHSASYHQLALHLLTREANTGKRVPTGNNIPTVNAGPDKAIPVSTPFTLTGRGTDADGESLTYVWDQLDMGIAKKLPSPNDLEGALFSRLVPTSNPSRTFPEMASVLAKAFSTATEQLPRRARDLNFRLTVNDNHQFYYQGKMVNASGINSDDVKITVVNNGGPFFVTSQQSRAKYVGGSTQTITWAVNGTDRAPINTQFVRIKLSTDGGISFPIILKERTPNNGFATVNMPNMNTELGRIKVEAIDNYYFAINEENFAIGQNSQLPGIIVDASSPSLLVNETGLTASYNLGLLTRPMGTVQIQVFGNEQTEVSLDGRNFSTRQTLSFNSNALQKIVVRGKADNEFEGTHTTAIQHKVLASTDVNYPETMLGQPVYIKISDAQIPAIIGIDFDKKESTETVTNWIQISDLREQIITNISLDDGSPTRISLATTATKCGRGGCGFGSDLWGDLPRHTKSLKGLSGVAYTQGTVTFTWSGLEPNRSYRIFVFGRGVFGLMKQTVRIQGSGRPITFDQNGEQGKLYINDQPSTSDLLVNFAKTVTASADGTIIITVQPNSGGTEMSFAGIGISK